MPVRVKLTHGRPLLDPLILRQSPGGKGVWGDHQFLLNQHVGRCDWWVVLENVRPGRLRSVARESTIVPPENVVLISWEPPSRDPYPPAFLEQFAAVVTSHLDMDHPHVLHGFQGQLWQFIGKSFDELLVESSPVKTHDLSLITSNKTWLEGHRRRLALSLAVRDHFGSRADLFGRGIRDFDDKWDVLAPYRYSLAVENDEAPEWITEKLTDCFITETIPFYAGGSRAEHYFPEGSFVPVPLEPEGAIEVMERTLADRGHYERNRPALLEARRRTIHELNLFPLLVDLLQRLEVEGRPSAPRKVTIEAEVRREPLLQRAVHRFRSRQGSP